MGIKDKYEKFHAVSYTDDAIQFSVSHSSRYIPDRFLPDKAIDLIDEAGARVKLRQTSLPEEITEVQKRIKFIVHRMENAIANHEFEKARFYSDEERKERDNLRALRDKYHLDDSSAGIVTREDIEDVVSRWTGVPVTSLKEEETQRLLRVEEELHKRVISQEKAISALARAIRRSRAGLEESSAADWKFPVPWSDGRRKDGDGAHVGTVPLWKREIADPVRYVGVHGETLSEQADRFASGIRGLRRGRTADGTRQAQSVLRGAAGRDREGSSGRLQPAAAGV